MVLKKLYTCCVLHVYNLSHLVEYNTKSKAEIVNICSRLVTTTAK